MASPLGIGDRSQAHSNSRPAVKAGCRCAIGCRERQGAPISMSTGNRAMTSRKDQTLDAAGDRRPAAHTASRRDFLWNLGGGLGGIALAQLLADNHLLA